MDASEDRPSASETNIYQVLDAAELSLWNGTDRDNVISNLTAGINEASVAALGSFITRLTEDLKSTAQKGRGSTLQQTEWQAHPELYLSETRWLADDLLVHQDWSAIDRIATWRPDDPASILLEKGRSAIGLLLDRLEDSSVARTRSGIHREGGGLPLFMRVREIAMCLIEQLSGCDFLLGQRMPRDVRRILPHLREWWERNRDRSREDGIRDEFDWAYREPGNFEQRVEGLVWMARNLAASTNSVQSAYGQEKLVNMIETQRSMEAAEALALLGNRRPFAILKERFDTPGLPVDEIFNRDEIQFLMRFGGPDEWRMIHVLAELEIASEGQGADSNDEPDTLTVLEVLLEDADARPPWVVPCLGMALSQTNVFDDDKCYAMDAAQALETLTGEGFGYQKEGSIGSRLSAVERATVWWRRRGKTAYSFERLTALWARLTPRRSLDPIPATGPRSIAEQRVPDGMYTFRWNLSLNRSGTAPEPRETTRSNPTELVIRVLNDQVECVKSSNPACVGARGSIESKGAGQFEFQLPIRGYEAISQHWRVRIDGSFRAESQEVTTTVKPVENL